LALACFAATALLAWPAGALADIGTAPATADAAERTALFRWRDFRSGLAGYTMFGVWIADGPGGLQRGLMCSATALWTGALLASRQRVLGRA
jgi:hypothetical protein